MRTRLELDNQLREICPNVYYQPPESLIMKYPAIRYSRYDIVNQNADNITYIQSPAFQVIVIDADPDSKIVESVAALPMCSYDRHYAADNLNHDVFTIYL